MTEKQAIKQIEKNIALIRDCDCTEYEMAIEALEKQIPMKPQAVLSSSGKKVYECMNCGNELSVNSFNGEYCHWCGQKLDWEENQKE